MGVKYVKDFEFPAEHGFTGSRGGAHVKSHMRNKADGAYKPEEHKSSHKLMSEQIVSKDRRAGHTYMRDHHGHHEGHMVLRKAEGGHVKTTLTARDSKLQMPGAPNNYKKGGKVDKGAPEYDFLDEDKREDLEHGEKVNGYGEYKYRKDSGDNAPKMKKGGKVAYTANSTFDEAEDRKTMNRFDKNDRRVAQEDGEQGLDGSTKAKRNWTDFKHGGKAHHKYANGGDVKVPASKKEDKSVVGLDHKIEQYDIRGPQGGVPGMGNARRKSHAEHPLGKGPSVKKSDSVRTGDTKLQTAGQRYAYATGGMTRNPRANEAIHAKSHKPAGLGMRGLGALAQAAGASMPPMGGGGGPGGMPGAPGMAPPPGLGAPPPGMKRGGRSC